ncbi:MAG TPA: CYTH domain-containing protein [Symbiobacteriaceae bacterium]|nr:CYTH domain-containing protein [Symbiobacteriaceae bacterium]
MEVEIKLNVKPAIVGGPIMLFTKLTMLPQIAGFPLGDITKHEIMDMYYDTPDGALAKAGAGLRSRIQDGTPYLTLKIGRYRDGALTGREEFEEVLTQERVDWVMSHARDLVGEGPFSAEDFHGGRPTGGLTPVLIVGTARLARPIGEVAELTLDMIEYPGLAANPFFDIEIEAKAGKMGERILRAVEEELYAMAGGDLAPAMLSKLERGLRLKEKAGVR